MITRRRDFWAPLLAGIVVAVVLTSVGLGLLTRTEPGREEILEYTLQTLGGRLNGPLVVERLEGSLFTGARLYGIVLRDTRGEVLLAADSAYLDYELPTFFGGDVVINRLVLYHPDLFLYRAPGDTLWNYQRVLQDTTPADTTRPGRATVIDRMRLVDAEVTVQMPWQPEEELSDREQAQEIRAALSDTSRLMVERVPGGLLRTMYFRVAEAVAGQLTIAPDERGGTYLRVERGTGTAQLYRGPPLRIRGMRGELSLRDGVLRYRAPFLRLPDSRLESAGVVDLRLEEPRYDLRVLGREVALRDLEWLYPPFPERGRAEFVMWLETRPDGTFYRLRDLRFATPDTRVAGRIAMLVGYDTLRVTEVDLTAAPLDVETIQAMLPTRIPVRGLEIGAVAIEGDP